MNSKAFLVVLSLFFSGLSQGQPLPGLYSYTTRAEGNPPKGEELNGPSGVLSLLKMEGNKYRFWLDVTIGWPSYNQGQLDGIIVFKSDAASFKVNFEDDEHPCLLNFKKKGNTISIDSKSTSYNCGFGYGVHADGNYARDKKQPVLNYAWLQEQNSQSAYFEVTTQKALLYQDENALRPVTAGSYFAKGSRLLNIDETQNTVYTEFITPAGKFLYGWMKKKDVKILDFGE